MQFSIKKVLQLGMFMVSLLVLYIGAVLLQGTLNDYQPDKIIDLQSITTATDTIIKKRDLSLLTWNIGYAGLGVDADFFYDNNKLLLSGNNMVYAPKQLNEKYLAGIISAIKKQKVDFYLLQEIDSLSDRSYQVNQIDSLARTLPNYATYLGVNAKIAKIPIPVFEPWHLYGKVNSGVVTYSRFQPFAATRYQLPGNFDWPDNVFQLDRCALLERFHLSDGHDLVLINVHLSAHDKDGFLKRKEMAYLQKLLMEEYLHGNYVVAGGDWNQCPPNFKFDTFAPELAAGFSQINIEADFMPADWQWAYDPKVPTNRKCKSPYQLGKTFVTLIDFWLVSPNVNIKKVQTINQNFANSDHQPVLLDISVGQQ